MPFYFFHLYLSTPWFNFVVGGDNEGPWLMPEILVNVHRAGDESVGVIKEVLPVC